MSKIVSTILILVSLLPRIASISLLIDYKINYQQYLDSCENKNKPDLKCDGKCHLKAMFPELVENNVENLPEEPTLKATPEILLFIDEGSAIEKNKFSDSLISKINTYNFSIQENIYFDFFVPPKLF